jgi:2-polyprenyl-3-methyl-5-hydroxy-6-metoxy-1,4-benzoquinol methylase
MSDMRQRLLSTAKQAALTLPPISRLVDHRDALLNEVDRLTRELHSAHDEADRLKGELHSAHDAIAALEAAARANWIKDAYSDDTPCRQNAFDIFKGEWSSDVPEFDTGGAGLFFDGRIDWLEQSCGGFTGKRILELGPLEGGHTFMMASRGAGHITAIEANTRAFLKCLIVKEALGFNAEFRLGDFRKYVKQCSTRFDFVLASGVLYHMTNPAELLVDLAQITDSLGMWTHYFDAEVIGAKPYLVAKFEMTPQSEQFGGRTVAIHRHRYLDAVEWKGFCGGSAPTSHWMPKDSILSVLTDLGFTVEIGKDESDHPNGPCMLLFAKRSPVRTG